MPRRLPGGTVTLLFTDVEGSTRLLHEVGADRYAELLAEHRRVLREAFDTHGGVEVDTQGDAFFAAFPTAPGAVAAARDGQEALREGPIRVRMGLHTGAPVVTDEGYVGADVHRGARVAALGHGGQVLLTAATRALLPPGADVLDLGLHRVKDFDGGAPVFQLGRAAFPPLRSPGAVILPTPASPFVGRHAELADAIATWYEREPRVLTVVGPGGAGKTRFALELARLLAEEADGGTVFVPLAPVRDAALALDAVAERLGASAADTCAIAARIGDRRVHLVLDNVEHLLPGVARPLAELVAAAPALRLLVTSREPLRIEGETELDLQPLTERDGVALFLDRARAVRAAVTESAAVHELVRRLDGLPLALELAAARMKLLAPEQLLERLGGHLDLAAGRRDGDERHSTLRATIAWSYDLLAPDEQALFARLAVLRGGWSIEWAEEVCDADLDRLASLLDKSLVRRRTAPDGSERLWMLETIRAFARERLADDPASELAVSRRHAEQVQRLARSMRLSSEDIGFERQDFGRVLSERENVAAALEWAARHDPAVGAEIATALEQYWVGRPHEGFFWSDRLLQAGDAVPPGLRARLLRLRGGATLLLGDVGRGEADYRAALAIFRELGDDAPAVGLMGRFAVHAGFRMPTDEARRLVEEVRTLNETVRVPTVEPQLLSTLAAVAYREGDRQEALALHRRSIEAAAACGFVLWELWELQGVQELELELGLVEESERTGRRALALARARDDRRLVLEVLLTLALGALGRGDAARAGLLWGAVAAGEREMPLLSLHADFEPRSAKLEACADDAFAAARARGAVLSLQEATSFALGEAAPPTGV